MDDDWAAHVDRYVDQLHAAGLIPPVNAVEVVGSGVSSELRITVAYELSDGQSARLETVLESVPHETRLVPRSSEGRRSGVSYR